MARLIERHRPEAPSVLPVLEPRVPSRFEPVRPGDGLGGLERDGELVTFRSGQPAPPEESPAPLRPRPWREQRERDDPQPSPDPRVKAVTAALEAARSTIRSMHIQPADPSSGTQADATARKVPEHRSSLEADGSRESRSTEHRVAAAAPPPSRLLVPADGRVGSSDREAVAKRDDQRADPDPTIRVTIGRIDVRAILPTAPTPRPAAKAENLSLADYLHGRHRGRR
ncbi:hypothetical protein [Candidatus Nitrospira bockiana]